MRIAEIFYSIQGEGTLTGVPSVFVRTSGCNLRCTWCDTPYTSWEPEGEDFALGEIVRRVKEHPARHVVVTGGEPMLFPEVVELTQRLREANLHITIETAGTVFRELECDLMSISPKLRNSTPVDREAGAWAAQHERLRYQPDVLRQLLAAYPYQLKFVVSSPEDLAEIQEMLVELDADRDRVMLMPEGTTTSTLAERGLWVAEICKREGLRFSPRLHVQLWGDRRGV